MLPGRRQECTLFSCYFNSFHIGNIACTGVVLLDNVNEACTLVVCTEAEFEYCVELIRAAASIHQSTSVRSDPT